MQYDKNKNVIFILAHITIKSLPDGTRVLHSVIAPSIREDGFSDAWFFFACHCGNGSSQIQGIDFDQYYSPEAHADFFRIKIYISDMHRLTARILDISNSFQNKNVSIHERVCASPPPYYIDWFKKSYTKIPLN